MVRGAWTRTGHRLIIGALAVAVLGAVAAATLPFFTTTEDTATGTAHGKGSALDAAGTGAFWLVVIPIVIVCFPLLVPPEARDGTLVGCVVLLGLFTFVSVTTVGLFFIPATLLVAAAAVVGLRHRSDPG